jgi:hypothetical protein
MEGSGPSPDASSIEEYRKHDHDWVMVQPLPRGEEIRQALTVVWKDHQTAKISRVLGLVEDHCMEYGKNCRSSTRKIGLIGLIWQVDSAKDLAIPGRHESFDARFRV